LFLLEDVKDEICKAEGEPTEKHNGRSCFSIQQLVKFIMFMEELASLVLNTIFLFSQLTQLEQTNKQYKSISWFLFVFYIIISFGLIFIIKKFDLTYDDLQNENTLDSKLDSW
jgi:hypothetical protein